MATNPTPAACLKCAAPLIPGAAFCGTCGTPAGSPGTPPLPPPMPPRPIGQGGRQVVMAMDSTQAMQAALAVLPAVKAEVTNQGPSQIAFRIGSAWTGRSVGAIDIYPDAPGRTNLNVSMKPDYSSLVPNIAAALAIGLGFYFYQQQQLYNPANYSMYGYTGMAPVSIWLIVLGIVAGIGMSAYWLGGPQLEKRRNALIAALQAQGAVPPGMPVPAPPLPGMPPQPGVPPMAGVPGQPMPAPVTPFEQLRKLAELRDSGAISAADYEQAKTAIMAKLS